MQLQTKPIGFIKMMNQQTTNTNSHLLANRKKTMGHQNIKPIHFLKNTYFFVSFSRIA